ELTQFNAGVSPGTIVFDVRSSVGIHEVEANVAVYPNPCTDQIQISGLTPNTAYALTDAAGTTMLNGSETVLSLTNFAPGIYFLNVNGTLTKIVKQ
ncbi:MAG: T9SS type A sorting domain-containing protein, partial [Crocinitomicaceae bacterium]